MTRLTMTQNRREFVKAIGDAKPGMYQTKKKDTVYTKKVACWECEAYHEEGKHTK